MSAMMDFEKIVAQFDSSHTDEYLSESMISGHLWTDGNSGTISQVNGTNIDNSTKVKRACDLLNLVRNNEKSRTNCQLSQERVAIIKFKHLKF
jgi:hypothetical protein